MFYSLVVICLDSANTKVILIVGSETGRPVSQDRLIRSCYISEVVMLYKLNKKSLLFGKILCSLEVTVLRGFQYYEANDTGVSC